jgi:hypothetical protein
VRVLLLQLDGKIPNLALMRLASHHRALGHAVTLRQAANVRSIQPRLDDPAWDAVYGSLVFERTRPVAEAARTAYPSIVLGGTGLDLTVTLEQHGVMTRAVDYTDYPLFRQSLGFTQRGCSLTCSNCVVTRK